jgi:hypothetical protein
MTNKSRLLGEKHAFPAARSGFCHFEAGMESIDIQLDD